MNRSVPEDMKELKQLLMDLDKRILAEVMAWARRLYQAVLEAVDALIMQMRPKTLSVAHIRSVRYHTVLGVVEVKRRHYHAPDGAYHYLLDKMVGMGKHQHTTPHVHDIAVWLASEMPFRKSADVLKMTTGIDLSHQTIWRLLQRVCTPYVERMDVERKLLLKTGELPRSEEQKIERLFVEADGVMLPLQRQRMRRTKVKVGIAYEGWKQVGKDRYRTVNKTCYADIADGEQFWAGMTVKLQGQYDLCGVKETIIGGDGAGWVKEGCEYLGGDFQLCRYHLNRELCRVLGHDRERLAAVRVACSCGNIPLASHLLHDAEAGARGDRARDLRRAHAYLVANTVGLGGYRGIADTESARLRGLGAIEGNVDKLVVRRMKNQGMSWSDKGIRRMLCARILVREGKLTDWVRQHTSASVLPSLPPGRINRLIDAKLKDHYADWLSAPIPALYGPHASRPWATVLKSLTRIAG